jgi:outer membrane protein OmpA-like peptidoglycan-associated protein
LAAAGLIWVGSHEPAAAQAYNGGPNQVIVNMDVLNGLPGGYGTSYGAPAQPYGQAPKSQFLPGAAPQGYAATPTQLGSPPLGAPRYLPPYTPYGVAGAEGQPLPLAPGLVGLATPPSSTPSSVLTTLGPDGRPIQPIKLKQPGTKQASKPKKKEYAAPAQPAPTETASAAEPAPEPAPEPTPAPSDEQVASVEPPAAPAPIPETVPMPEATPVPSDSDATVESAPAVTAPEPPAEEASAEPVEEPAAAPEAPAPEVPAPEAATPEAPAAETSVAAVTPEAPPAETAASDPEPAEEPAPEATEEGATEEGSTEIEATAAPEPDNSQPAAPIPQGGIRIVFPTDLNDVPPEANAALDDLASQMLADENMRIQIKCYASGTEDTESKARRKSLARCINIRQYLFKKDVRTTRMDVRALGLKSEGQPADRVDIVPPES